MPWFVQVLKVNTKGDVQQACHKQPHCNALQPTTPVLLAQAAARQQRSCHVSLSQAPMLSIARVGYQHPGCAHLYHSVMTRFVSLPFWSMCQLRAKPKSAILRQPSLHQSVQAPYIAFTVVLQADIVLPRALRTP
jgi:hypothetical protein